MARVLIMTTIDIDVPLTCVKYDPKILTGGEKKSLKIK